MVPCKVGEIIFIASETSGCLIFMKASFMVSEGISSGAKFETEITIVTRMLDVARLNVFV